MSASPNLFSLDGKVALVTGAGSGLGLAFAQGLAAQGATVVCADRNAEWAERAVGLVGQSGAKATAITVDVADVASVEAMMKRIVATHRRIDILFNNAGIATKPYRVHELPVEDWDRLIAINLRGVFLCTRGVLPVMLANGGGSIVSIASIIGIVGCYPGHTMVNATYAASKAGVSGFTRQLAVEYAKDNIRANAIAPGWHGGTRLGTEAREGATPEAIARFESSIANGVPMGRRGTPEELVGLAVYLASDASRYLTGQTIVHDGGWTSA
ncbi:MAG: SDR family NAD(P)-dependent oxidoreductase [Burkholderiales bacterium]